MKPVIHFKFLLICLCVDHIFSYPAASDSANGDHWTLHLVHTNDMHARFEQTSIKSERCEEKDAQDHKCYGGFARITTLVKNARNSGLPTIFLNAGDTYQGSTWFAVHKWKIASEFLNLLKPDVASLGNHEFDNGPLGLLPFLKSAEFPIVAANLDLSKEPKLEERLKKSYVLDVNNHKIGIIGYLTQETKAVSNVGNVTILDEIESIREEVKRLQEEGVNILIALGHSGYKLDQKMAEEIEGLDLVVGGHSHSLLYTGDKPNLEKPEGPYPTVITQKSGKKVYVVQAGAYTKYFGNLTIEFDSNGEIVNIQGKPILVDSSIKEDKDALELLEKFRPKVEELYNTVVGSTRVFLDGTRDHCRRGECNLGDLMADAMIDYNIRNYKGKDWTDAAVAFIPSGTLRVSIDVSPDMNLTMNNILELLPFENDLVILEINGKQLLSVLEHSIYKLKENEPIDDLSGQFLQFSGLQVLYDLTKPSGSRVVTVSVRCAECRVPVYEPLEQDKVYKVITVEYLSKGGNGYSMLKDLPTTSLKVPLDKAFASFLKAKSPIYPGVEWRMEVIHSKDQEAKQPYRVPRQISGSSRISSVSSVLLSCLILIVTRNL